MIPQTVQKNIQAGTQRFEKEGYVSGAKPSVETNRVKGAYAEVRE
jgi:hypothetical protein